MGFLLPVNALFALQIGSRLECFLLPQSNGATLCRAVRSSNRIGTGFSIGVGWDDGIVIGSSFYHCVERTNGLAFRFRGLTRRLGLSAVERFGLLMGHDVRPDRWWCVRLSILALINFRSHVFHLPVQSCLLVKKRPFGWYVTSQLLYHELPVRIAEI
jgi:hypothetical protein